MVWPLAGETAHEPEPGLDQQPAISSQQHALHDSSFCYDISSSSSFSSDSNRPSNRPSCSSGSRDDDYAFDDISAFDDNSLLLWNFDI